ncbi:protein-L-isoaspartate O-methyltransferase family protein [Streptomyces wuyuanensis]|uniref:protein-L-isoaspartate O-methyltransferase family protein n=1 Tax=Streptomyces wuyuanensis TaxID=1196353 RepID=UPI0034153732
MTTPHAAFAEALLCDITDLIGELPDTYARALRRVPRHLFLPDRIWLRDGDGGYRPCDRTQDPDGWMAAAYTDTPLVTQFTDDVPASSASMPSMVLRMLLLAGLDDPAASPPRRVMELGAGTGFHAALLCELLDERAVTTLELDSLLAAQAERNAKTAGYAPEVVVGDAALGWSPGAPYDRIVATFSVDRLPQAWLQQITSGGRIVTPWTSTWCCYGTLALAVEPDGVARGRFHAFASFMPMRRPDDTRPTPRPAQGDAFPSQTGTSPVSPWQVAGGDLDAEFHIGLAVPGAVYAWDTSGVHAPTRLHITDTTSSSWATVDYDGRQAHTYAFTQAGPRRLWDEITTAYTEWEALGRPGTDLYQLEVSPFGRHHITVHTATGQHTVREDRTETGPR